MSGSGSISRSFRATQFFAVFRALLNVKFWRTAQDNIRAGHVEDFFPYPEDLRFCRAFAGS